VSITRRVQPSTQLKRLHNQLLELGVDLELARNETLHDKVETLVIEMETINA
jgi:hypothetical protein